ncbi:unannotated protein [freshwater metagenome]|uniref:Unannotated protein n=1 Tax=freshwater metagenome TaxID=449393 RepID=A0A6J7FGD3_9ZZZZ
MIDDGDAVGELIGLFEVLRGEQHRGALGVEPTDLFPQGEAAHRVKAGGGFVEEQHGGLVDERQRQVEAATHAARIRADTPCGSAGEADALEQVVAAALHM